MVADTAPCQHHGFANGVVVLSEKRSSQTPLWLCRFLTRLLLVHGSLSAYRLSRLIKYSFYKNIAFGFLLFYYQFYCGFSGQSMVDDISAAAFNVVFTSLPILLFAVLDRPVHNLNTLLRFPQVYTRPEHCLPHTPLQVSAVTIW